MSVSDGGMCQTKRQIMFILQKFKSNSGLILPFKIECDTLTYNDWRCLAAIAASIIGEFGDIEGVPQGGLPFANTLSRYKTKGPLLIVDDVLTTGGSMERQRDGRQVKGIVAFARSTPPDWVQYIFLLNTKGAK